MTGNREDYIKVIYELGGERNKVSTKDIASALDVSMPSVSEMLRKLADEKILDYEVYKGVTLTSNGVREAVRIKKVHILWEVFLVDKLGYALEDVHEEAELLEHITSKKLEEKLEEYLGYPEICPHGTPLNHDEYLFDYLSLTKVAIDEIVRLKRFKDEKQFLINIKDLDLKVDDVIQLKSYDSKNDVYTIHVNDKLIELPQAVASKIFVSKA
ncbi:MAG: metal-dependent transcriptional regulator [Erysipelothrix sp.]|nr:metal-dependent transcriptional regulator [Erysipelothrix sp.]